MVLDDAVVDDGDDRAQMRVRVALGRRAVSRPARMADADRAAERLGLKAGHEPVQLALSTPTLHAATGQGGDAGTIVAAIFETPKGFEQKRSSRSLPDD